MTTSVEAAQAEIDKQLETLAPQHRGLREYALLELGDAARREIMAEITLYDRRVSLLTAAKEALADLESDGYPDMPVRVVNPDVLADLRADAADLEAALAKFSTPAAAASLQFEPGIAVPKE